MVRGLRFLGNRKSEVVDFPDERPGPGEVLIKVRASGMCGSDLHRYRADPAKQAPLQTRPGHEPCGEIVELGAGVKDVKAGDRIMQHHYLGCMECKYCRAGWTQLCPVAEKRRYYGGSDHGGHGGHMVADYRTCVALPDEVSFDAGAYLACGASTAFQALKKLDVSGRDVLAVFGQGPVGLAATMLGTAMGARVVAVDISKERLKLAGTAGAWKTIDNSDGSAVAQIKGLTHGEGADAALEAAGHPVTRVATVEATRIFGRACLVGEGGTVTYEATPHIIHRHLTLLGSWTFSTFGMAEAARFVADRGVQLEKVITDRVSIERLPAAYTEFDKGQSGKMVVTWP
jgi:threonine dehydrogenase-like Zn-dependent dehydrogenase